MLTDIFFALQKAFGLPEERLTDNMTIELKGTGQLTFEENNQEVLVSLVVPIPSYDTNILDKAIRLAHYSNPLPMLLWVGHYKDSLILITAVERAYAAEKTLREASDFLLNCLSQLKR